MFALFKSTHMTSRQGNAVDNEKYFAHEEGKKEEKKRRVGQIENTSKVVVWNLNKSAMLLNVNRHAD